MINRVGMFLMLFLLTASAFAQIDSIEMQISNYEETKSVLISKGRKLLLDKFIEGDIRNVKEVKNYLRDEEDKEYFALYPLEYWFILYWTKEYYELADNILYIDSAKIASYNTRIRPPDDQLYEKLKEKSFQAEKTLKENIQNSSLDNETKQMLLLNFDYIVIEERENIYAQDSLNNLADEYLKEYPLGRFEDFTRRFIRYKLVPKNWGMAFEFFTGYGFYNGALNENYTNNIPIGVAFDVCYKDLTLYLRDYIGFNKTKKDFDYSLGTWEKGSNTMVFLPEASLGYTITDNNFLKVSPFLGIGTMDISPPTADTEETPELKEVSLEFTTTYMLGINLDIKFGPRKVPAFSPKTSYGFLRIRYSYNQLNFEKKYSGMTGDMHYVTIGFGGMGRLLRREY